MIRAALAWVGIALGIVLAVILICAVLLIFWKICVIIRYEGGKFSLAVRVGPVTVRIFPARKKKKSKKKTAQKTGRDAKKAPDGGKKARRGKKLTASDIAGLAREAFGGVVPRLYFERLHVDLTVAGPDAAAVALEYGRLNAAVYPLAALIYGHKRFRDLSIRIQPDFLAEKPVYDVDAVIYTRAVFLLGSAVRIAKYLL